MISLFYCKLREVLSFNLLHVRNNYCKTNFQESQIELYFKTSLLVFQKYEYSNFIQLIHLLSVFNVYIYNFDRTRSLLYNPFLYRREFRNFEKYVLLTNKILSKLFDGHVVHSFLR